MSQEVTESRSLATGDYTNDIADVAVDGRAERAPNLRPYV